MDNLVYLQNDEPVCSSLQVAEKFGKRHDNVMQSIRGLLKNEGTHEMFKKSSYIEEQNNQKYPMYLMNRDGFSLLVMGFTGKKALQMQLIQHSISPMHIPWHTSDETKHCKFYSNADMAKITATAMTFVTWHITYFRDLRIYIRSLESKEDVGRITYGTGIPEAYQSEPLKAMLAQKS